MRMFCNILLGFALTLSLSLSAPLFAAEEQLKFKSAADKSLYDSLIIELRCLVCQNQNIADSNAELAKDLRNKTYELIQSGQSESQIKQFMRDRYGDFVLYAPPLDPKTWLLWLGPFFLLIIVLFLVGRFIRQQSRLSIDDETTLDNETSS